MKSSHSRVLEVDADDPPVGGAVALGIKRRGADEKLVHEHAQGPDIHGLVVVLQSKPHRSSGKFETDVGHNVQTKKTNGQARPYVQRGR